MFLNTAVWIKVMLAILIAFVVSFALTPVVKILAQKVGAMDVPGEARRVHDHPIPRMGGLAIFLAVSYTHLDVYKRQVSPRQSSLFLNSYFSSRYLRSTPLSTPCAKPHQNRKSERCV